MGWNREEAAKRKEPLELTGRCRVQEQGQQITRRVGVASKLDRRSWGFSRLKGFGEREKKTEGAKAHYARDMTAHRATQLPPSRLHHQNHHPRK
jgi:hypothetical protein